MKRKNKNKKSKHPVDDINYIAKPEDVPQLTELVKQLEDADKKYLYFHEDVSREGKIKDQFNFGTNFKISLIKKKKKVT